MEGGAFGAVGGKGRPLVSRRRRGARPDEELARAREGLKDFQRDTVRVVVDAMFRAEHPQRRFLVADEVGLGKTKVARAVVAETVERLWDDPSVDRIDIVYICSNHQIARQNIRDLRVVGDEGRRVADRITMLPAILADLGPVNLVAFTPATSLAFGSSRGRAGERAMLYRLLRHRDVLGPATMRRESAKRLLSLDTKSFHWELAQLDNFEVPAPVARKLGRNLRRRKLDERFAELSHGRRWRSGRPDGVTKLIGELRRALAEACIELLSPDLVILDEFQRFSHVLHGEGDDGYLANLLMEQPSTRVLMLSATPYRMLSGADDDESHFDGFMQTVGSLLGDDGSGKQDALEGALLSLRRGVLARRPTQELAPHRDTAQGILRSVMVRTERLASTPSRDGMLRLATDGSCKVTRVDVDGFIGTDRVARVLEDVPSMIEYWKSAPYLFNFMDDYKVKREIADRLGTGTGPLGEALRGPHMLDWARVERHQQVEPMNGRLRWLADDLTTHHAWDLLWLPPALPQTGLAGHYVQEAARRFTKRLVFSSWTVVPKAVAGLLSYEVERRHHRRRGYSRRESSGKLTLRGEGASFTVLALLLPCARLVELGDPVQHARDLGVALPVPLGQLRARVRSAIRRELAPHLARAPRTGRPDVRWYAVAQVVLDGSLTGLATQAWTGQDAREAAGLDDHLDRLRGLHPEDLDRPPDDLVDVLVDLAIGGPAVTALRALIRLDGRFGWEASSQALATGAARLAWAFRSVVSSPEAESIVQRSAPSEPYWRALLRHSVDGGLGSVLDEWLHLVPDQERLDASTADPIGHIVAAAVAVLTLEASKIRVEMFVDGDGGTLTSRHETLRPHFAVRFGQAQGTVAEGDNPLHVRQAFNSPFWPFVLVSTSVGQEGLDFHHYSHAVVHWNLPSSPVELEQREGRVHRYKNHAVRKNVARRFGADPALLSSDDTWSRAFELAEAARPAGMNDMSPWWVFADPEGAAIERHVPMLPMSRDVSRLAELTRATGIYRMAMGQPRQVELMAVLAEVSDEALDEIRRAIIIDLSPKLT